MILIAEYCQNHNGDFEILKRMIHESAAAGATHGKIQTIYADDLSFRPEFEEGMIGSNGEVQVIKRPYQPEYDRLKKLELTFKQHEDFFRECERAGITPLTTAFTLASVSKIAEIGWTDIKIASYDCGSAPLLRLVANRFNRIFVSTGASYDDEIRAAAGILKESGKDFALLHCVTIYPTPLDQMHLNRMDFLRSLSNTVGLSSHPLSSRDGVKADLAAIYRGAKVIERHFTVLPEESTRDGKVSINPEQMREIADFVKLSASEKDAYIQEHIPDIALLSGRAERELTHEELLNRAYYRGRFCSKIDGRQVFNWEEEYESAFK